MRETGTGGRHACVAVHFCSMARHGPGEIAAREHGHVHEHVHVVAACKSAAMAVVGLGRPGPPAWLLPGPVVMAGPRPAPLSGVVCDA